MTPVSTGESDTIAAVASPPGQGAVSLIRVSGKDAITLVTSIFLSRKSLTPRTAVLGKIVGGDGGVIDEVLATAFPNPASYTGEDTVEIACHGGVLVTKSVLARLLEAGARAAEAGEFSRRAFQNGKMDLTQAEAVMDLISAQTERGLRAAHEQLAGRLGEEIMRLRETLLGSLAHLEATLISRKKISILRPARHSPRESRTPARGWGISSPLPIREESFAKECAPSCAGAQRR